jgi:Adenylate and Guanylate cyclase catalytic domain
MVDSGGEIFGDVPNIAARAQALAEPGSVVVTARVQRQIAGLFVAEERGSHALKGVPEPVTCSGSYLFRADTAFAMPRIMSNLYYRSAVVGCSWRLATGWRPCGFAHKEP